MKILFVVNKASFFVSHRLPIAEHLMAQGWSVSVASPPNTGGATLRDHGIEVLHFPLNRRGFNPLEEMRTFLSLWRIYRKVHPDLVHHVTSKPIIYGTPAARWAGVPGVVNAVPGLGSVYTREGLVAAVARRCLNVLYRGALAHPNMRVIFQNSQDLNYFVQRHVVERDEALLIRGSGVDLAAFHAAPEPQEVPCTVLLISRMLRDKGVTEFVHAAQSLRARYPQWRFVLAGGIDSGNPSTFTEAELRQWQTQGAVEWVGHSANPADVIRAAHVVCVPSYREGLPKVLLEASACGRAIVASDIAGCREVITHRVNGLLVPPRTVAPLADAIEELGLDAELRQRLGRAAHARAQAVFAVEDIVEHTCRVYDSLLAREPQSIS